MLLRSPLSPPMVYLQSSNRLKLALQATRTAIWEWHIPTGQMLWSENIEQLFGLSTETFENIYEALLACVHPQDRERVSQAIATSVRDRSSYQIEFRILWPDHTIRWLSSKGEVLCDEQDQPQKVTGLCIDITHDKQAEVALQEERDLVSAIFDVAGALMLVLDPQGRIVRFNKACEKVTGYCFEQVRGQYFWELFLRPAEVEAAKAKFRQLQTSTIAQQHESRWITREGETRWIAWSNTALLEPDGSVKYVVATGIDITERKHAEAALNASERRLRKQSEVLVELTRRSGTYSDDLPIRLQQITEAASRSLEVARASIWLYSRDRSKISCLDLYEQTEARHSSGIELSSVDYPTYFAALRTERTIAAHDARADSRTCEFLDPYLTSLGITSMLDAPIWLDGEMVGVVCHEHIGPPRVWAIEEQNFAGSIADLVSLAMEACERQRAEAELQKSQQRLELLFQQAPIAVIEWNTNSEVTAWNPAAEAIFGYSCDEAIGRHAVGLITPAQATSAHKDVLWTTLLTQDSATYSIQQNCTRDGRTIICEWHNTPLVDADGNIIGAASLGLDVTQRVQAEAALKQSKVVLEKRVGERTAELHDVIQQLRDEIVERRQAETALRYSEADLRQRTQQLEKTLHDLRKAQAQLVQSEKMSSLGQLVAGVAHEINNPVNFIYGNLSHASQYTQELLNLLSLYQRHYSRPVAEIEEEIEAIDLEFLVEDLPKILSSMKLGADRIRQIVLSLRNFSRLDQAEKKPVDIHEGIDSTLLILQSRLKDKTGRPGIQVVKQYGELPLIECYAGQLNQVFMNILTNALDALDEYRSHAYPSATGERSPKSACPEPSIITISTERIASDWVRIRMRDNGPGMPESVRQQLFDPFFTTKPVGKGTGMGLSISYQIVVDKHGGRLECWSEPNQGTEFVIEIPIYQGDRAD